MSLSPSGLQTVTMTHLGLTLNPNGNIWHEAFILPIQIHSACVSIYNLLILRLYEVAKLVLPA